MRRPLTRVLLAALLGAAAVSAWVFLAPRQLPGGSASYVVPTGTSMLPLLDRDDLVITREAPIYRVGDVIAYHSVELDRTVLHRVVSIEQGRYVTGGDNNDWLDRDRPSDSDVLGRMVVRIPGGGSVLAWIRTPRNAAVAGTAAAVLVMGGMGLGLRRRRRRRRSEPPRPAPRAQRPSHAARVSAAALGVTTMGLAALTLFVHHRPETRSVPTRVGYEHEGSFGYVALAEPGAVYPDGQVDAGEPVFLRVADIVGVRFVYRFVSEGPHAISGTAGLVADLEDGTGWSRSFALQEPTSFAGDEAAATGTLDLRRIGGLIRQVEAETEIPRPTYTLTLRPSIEIEGTVATRTVRDSFAPALAFEASPLLLRLAEPEDPEEEPSDALAVTRRGSVVIREDVANPLTVGPVTLDPATARRVGATGTGVAAVLFLVAGLMALRGSRTESARIHGRYGHRIVPIAAGAIDGPVIDVATMGALVRVADSYERMILHEERDDADWYLVEGDVALYRYRTDGIDPPRADLAETAPATLDDMLEGTFLDEPPEPDTRFLDEPPSAEEEPDEPGELVEESEEPKVLVEEPDEPAEPEDPEEPEVPEVPVEEPEDAPAATEDVSPAEAVPTPSTTTGGGRQDVPPWPGLPSDDETRWRPQPAASPASPAPADHVAEATPPSEATVDAANELHRWMDEEGEEEAAEDDEAAPIPQPAEDRSPASYAREFFFSS